MDHKEHNLENDHTHGTDRLKHDLDPGRQDRNLFSDHRQEAPIDKDRPMTSHVASDAGDENYEDEELNDPDYYEKRADDNVRK